MLSKIKKLLDKLGDAGPTEQDIEKQARLAAAVLLVEVMMADDEIAAAEKKHLSDSLEHLFDLDAEELDTLVELAKEKHDVLVSLHEMTNIINTHFSYQRKLELILLMWRMAYADRRWDKYEEHLIRKVSDLLYVSHKDFIRCRHQAQPAG